MIKYIYINMNSILNNVANPVNIADAANKSLCKWKYIFYLFILNIVHKSKTEK